MDKLQQNMEGKRGVLCQIFVLTFLQVTHLCFLAAGGVGDGRRRRQRRGQWRRRAAGSGRRWVAVTMGGETAVARSINSVLQTSNQLHNTFVTFVAFVAFVEFVTIVACNKCNITFFTCNKCNKLRASKKKPCVIRLFDCLKTHWDFFGRTENTARRDSSQHLRMDFLSAHFFVFSEKRNEKRDSFTTARRGSSRNILYI